MLNPEPLFVDENLLSQAEQLCKRQLAKAPENRPVLASLANIYRKQGKLVEATALYAQLTKLDPDDREAGYMHAVLAGNDVPPAPAGIHPAPFVLLKDFLPSSFHETLIPFALSVQDRLVPATVGNNEYKPDSRQSLDLPGKFDVKHRFYVIAKKIIPKVIARLRVAPFEIVDLEVKLRAYLDGHFFRIHMDCPPDSEQNVNRKVSYVYFFHKVPRVYRGGDLLLFDSDIATNKFTTCSFTRVVPEDNCIILFPSAYWHSVVPVSCPSKEFADSRFVINGHAHNRLPKPVIDTTVDTVVNQTAPVTSGDVAVLAIEGSSVTSPS